MANPFIERRIRCAGPGCTAVKTDTNHWFLLVSYKTLPQRAVFFRWSEAVIVDYADEVLPVCGETCATKLLNRFLCGEDL